MTTRDTFMGKPLEEMSREELMDAVVLLAGQLEESRHSGIEGIRFMRDIVTSIIKNRSAR